MNLTLNISEYVSYSLILATVFSISLLAYLRNRK
jgi:hypothetical protein